MPVIFTNMNIAGVEDRVDPVLKLKHLTPGAKSKCLGSSRAQLCVPGTGRGQGAWVRLSSYHPHLGPSVGLPLKTQLTTWSPWFLFLQLSVCLVIKPSTQGLSSILTFFNWIL